VNLIIPEIVSLHLDEAASLIERRRVVLDASQVNLKDVQRAFDDRIAAHLDALSIAGEDAWPFCEAALEEPSAGAVFTAAVRAIEDRRADRLEALLALIGAVRETRYGFTSALGWVGRDRLQGLGSTLLASSDPLKRAIGMVACSMHRVDPGLVSGGWLRDADTSVRARSIRLVGEIGYDDAVPACAAALNDADIECRFWGAWSAVLLGNRGIALERLTAAALTDGQHIVRAFRLALQAMNAGSAHSLLKDLATHTEHLRPLIHGSGIAGDSTYVPWLMNHMRDDKTARVAGEAFSLITGADLSALKLDRPQPETFESGPNDDPDDPNVDMDPDEGLPWPDPDKVEKWWTANASRFHKGSRYFMGAPVTREHCIDVLKNGYQRQRILAAHYLCLLEPGTPLFNTSAPAWRQQRLLARL
jgi:uncharacterized protein (TIGR02270 family)